MWNRLKRLFRSIFGGIIEKAEDPELILQQTIRDMRERVPQCKKRRAGHGDREAAAKSDNTLERR